MLLIDASNSMKGSIQSAMQAARAFAARNPGQPLSVVFFNSKPTVALPLTDGPQAGQRGARKAAEARRGDADQRRARRRRRPGTGLGARRGDGSCSSPTATTWAAPRASIPHSPSSTRRRSACYTVGIQSPDFTSDDLQKIADETGGTYASATSPEALTKIYDELGFQLGNEYLLRYRSTRPARPGRRRLGDRAGHEPVTFAYTIASTGTAAPYEPALRDRLLQSWLLIPLVVGLILALVVFTIRSLWSLRSNKALVARLGEFVTLPAEEQAAARRKEVDVLLAAASNEKKRSAASAGSRASPRTSTSRRSTATPQDGLVSVLLGLLVAVARGRPDRARSGSSSASLRP